MPHKETPSEFNPSTYPPFPDSPSYPTINLQTISLSKLQANDAEEQSLMFEACKDWGFFYLDLTSSGDLGETLSRGSEDIARVAEEIFHLPLEEKMKYALTGKDLFGYKKVGQTQVDKNHTPDTAEFFNVAKNEMIVPEGEMTRSWPKPVLENRELFGRYSTAAHKVGLQILDVLARKLGIDPEEIHSRHRLEEWAGDHVRMTRGPPRKSIEMPEIQTPSHTDFGT
jgi:isopenicillin N synthase-like dioxygenase